MARKKAQKPITPPQPFLPKQIIFAGLAASCFSVLIIGITLAWKINQNQAEKKITQAITTEHILGSQTNGIEALADTSTQIKGIYTTSRVADARPIIVANFLARHNSPLEPHQHFGQVFVELADKHDMDFRLLPAIAMQESNLCKRIPPGSYNCLGFGIHERGTLMFESYEANFARAARELKANYIDIGLTTPEDIMRKYTPSSTGSWASSVNQWMAEMNFDDREKGRDQKTNASVLEFAL